MKTKNFTLQIKNQMSIVNPHSGKIHFKLFIFVIYMAFGLINIEFAGCQRDKDCNSSDKSIEGTTVEYLEKVMDQFNKFSVYLDLNSAGNNFFTRAKMSSEGGLDALPAMDEGYRIDPHSGKTCIRVSFKSQGNNWGGWYFMNGIMQGNDNISTQNWGDYPEAGINLQGSKNLSFWAKGEKGGERIEFFCCGVGRNPNNGSPIKPYPDSSPKISTGYIILSEEWKFYTINLEGRDLRYVLGGFGWVTNSLQNSNADITFYLDDITFQLENTKKPRFLLSYETILSNDPFDSVIENVAFTYDNCVTLMAFLASGQPERAKIIADALVYSQHHDRYFSDGCIRNSYQGGNLILPPGWYSNNKPGCVRLPGWFDINLNKWLEDSYQVGSNTGNIAWAMLALLAYYETCGGSQYLESIIQLGEFVEKNFRDNLESGGYTAGFEGWEPNPAKLTYKATEHNIDLFAAFKRIFLITSDKKWSERADHAKGFVLSMWDQKDQKFFTGTTADGMTISKENLPFDIQVWSILALKEESSPYLKALDFAETNMKVGEGFDFNNDRDGIWYEGTAQASVAYKFIENEDKYKKVLSFLESRKSKSGGLPATDNPTVTTGFYLSNGQPWVYYHRTHIGATAWLVLAEYGYNPFWGKL
jgi:hypothetical protein